MNTPRGLVSRSLVVVITAVSALWASTAVAGGRMGSTSIRAAALDNARSLFGHLGKVGLTKNPVFTDQSTSGYVQYRAFQVTVNGQPINQAIYSSGRERTSNLRNPAKKLKTPVLQTSFHGVWSVAKVDPRKSGAVTLNPYLGLQKDWQRGQNVIILHPDGSKVRALSNGEVLGTARLDDGLVATAISPVAPRQGPAFTVKAKVGKTKLSAPYKDSSHHRLEN